MFKRIISLALSVVFSLQTCGFAQAAQLNLAGYLGQGLSSVSLDRFHPASLRYFSYEPKTDNFQILLDKADEKGLSDTQVKDKADELMKYFRIGLSLPNDKFWVNLRPDAPEQIIDPELEQTDIGKIMLESDLELKKDTASFTSPQTKEGKEYWDKLYQKAGELFGSENITIPTLTRPWIVPGEIIVRESGDSGSTPLTTSAYIYKAALKVLLEEDYLKSSQPSDPNYQPLTSNYNFSDPRLKELNQYSTQLIRELILPKLTKEINRSKRYAGLRQVFYSLILARWFKGKFQGQSPSGTVPDLIDSGNLDNLTSQKPWSKDTYYREYKKSFEQGEYNLSETVHTPTGQLIRRYVSGGVFNLAAEPTGGYKETVGSAIVKPVNGALLNLNGNYIKETKIAASPLTVEEAKNAAIQKIRKTNIKEIDEKYVPRIKTAESFEHIYNQIVKFTLENEKKIKKEDMRELINEKERLERYIAADYFKQNGITVDLIRQQTRRIMIAAGRQAELNQPVDMYIDFKASGEYFKGWRNMKMHIHENAEDIKRTGFMRILLLWNKSLTGDI